MLATVTMTAVRVGDLPSELRESAEWAMRAKEDLVKDHPSGEDVPIRPCIEFYRDGKMRANVFCPNVDRNEALQVLRVGIPGWAADVVQMYLDASMIDDRWYKEFGRHPDPGELQEVDRSITPAVVDAIMVVRATRDGQATVISLPYKPERGRVQWLDGVKASPLKDHAVPGSDERMILLALRKYFAEPTGPGERGYPDPAEHGLTPEEGRINADVGMVRLLSHLGFPTGMATYTDEEKEILDASIKRDGGLNVHAYEGDSYAYRPADPNHEPDLIEIMATLLVKPHLENERKQAEADEMALADRLRQARGEPPKSGDTPNRADRRRAERKNRRKGR